MPVIEDEINCDPIEPAPSGPGLCTNHVRGCANLEDGNSPTGECVDCVEKAHAFQEWLDRHTLDDTDLNDPPDGGTR